MKITRLVTTLALFIGLSAAAQSQPIPQPRPPIDPSVRTLRVEGAGEAKAEPDEAYVDLAVETSASTAKAAGEENARRMERVIAALTAAGIPRKDIDTRHYTVFPDYAPPALGAEPKLRGYRASNTVAVYVRELARLGELLDRALAAGANRVDAVRFALSREDAVRAEALRQAVERARKTAEVLAASLGLRLGAVLDASTVAEAPRLFPANLAMEAADARGGVTTPIQPEEQTVRAQVTLIYAIEGSR